MGPEFSETRASTAVELKHRLDLRGHREGVKALAISRDGQWMVSGDSARRVVVWKNGTAQYAFDPMPLWERWVANRRVFALEFSHDARQFFVGMTERLAAYNIESGHRTWLHKGPRMLAFLPASPVHLSLNPVSGVLAAAFDDGHVGFWDSDGTQREYWFDNDAPRQFAFTRDGSRLVGSDSFSICIWDASTHAKIARQVPDERVHALALSPADEVAASRTLYDVSVWHLETGETLGKVGIGRGAPLVKFSPTRRSLVYTEQETIKFIDFEGHSLAEHSLTGTMPLSLAFTPDGRELRVGCLDGVIRCFETPE